MKERQAAKAEYLKIRDYIIGIVVRAGQKSVLLPSARDLQSKFNVAMATVVKALNVVRAEGYTIVRRGVGTFTNPQMNSFGVPMRIVGHFSNRGNDLLQDYSSWSMISLAGLELTKSECMMRQIKFDGAFDAERIEAELRSFNLDALLYVGADPVVMAALEKLSADGLPVVTTAHVGVLPAHCYDIERSSRQVGRILASEGRTRICGLISFMHDRFKSGFEHAYREAAANLELRFVGDLDGLRRELMSWVPDCIYISGHYERQVLDLLDKLGIDYHRQCRLVSFRPRINDARFCGLHQTPPEEEMASGIASELLALMDGRKVKPAIHGYPLHLERIRC